MSCLTRVDLPGLSKIRSGKVRELYDAGAHFLIVATDRISAFDCILPDGIPDKGRVLNLLSAWWFKRLRDVVPHHMVSVDPGDFPPAFQPHADQLKGRAMLVRKTRVFPVECIARGYLTGSGWKEYAQHGTVCGIPLRTGYQMAAKLDEPLFTPATKAESGHDENISFSQMAALIGPAHADALRTITLTLYRHAATHAASRGIILADTKFEFGLDENGTILLIDEALTPDSSRYWPAADYRAGVSPPSFDKQFVRDYLESVHWNKQPPAPALPPEIIARTALKYREAFRAITGQTLPD